MKQTVAGIQQFVTEMIKPWIDYFSKSFGPLSEGIDSLIGGFRDLISSMSNFSGIVMTVGGILAGGVIITKTAGLVVTILQSALIPTLAKILQIGFKPIGLLAQGSTKLLGLLTNNVFTRSIASAVVGGLGGLGKLIAGSVSGALGGVVGTLGKIAATMKMPNAAGKGGLGLGLGLATLGVDALAGAAGVGSTPIDQEQDNKNWEKMNWWQTIESSLARGVENVGDYIAPNIANEARANRIKNETEYLNGKAVEESKLDDSLLLS